VDNYQYNRGHSSNFGDDDETTNRYLRNPYENRKSNKALLEKNHHDFNNQYATTTTSSSSSYKPAPKVNFEFVHKNSTSKETTRRDKENNHLGSSSEASTQTSFVEAANGAASSASSSVAGSLSSGEIKRQATSNEEQKANKRSGTSSKKEKIQQIIQLQKQQHEKRVKALEKLAQLERMHAEKLRQIMLNNSHNDSSITSLIYDSFFQNSNIQNPNGGDNDTTTFDLDQLEREIKEQEYKLLSSDGHSNKNRFMIKNATSNSTSTAAAAASKRQSCMNFNEFKSMSHFLSGRKRMDDDDEDDDDNAAAVLPQRRNSEFYMKPSSVSQSEFGQGRRYNNLKNFTHDLPPFNNNKTETPSSSVEILNLKNTTVLESRKPEGKLKFTFSL